MDYFNYSRREASEVYVGGVPMGGNHPIRIQSMTNTPTTDTEACVEQAIRIIEAGGEYVRLTHTRSREPEEHQHRFALTRLRHTANSRCALQSEGSRSGCTLC